MSFKKDFLWGGATAANQCEGAFDANGNGPSWRMQCRAEDKVSPFEFAGIRLVDRQG